MQLEIEPGAAQVAVKFLGPESTAETSLAICVGVGKDVSVCKRGETVSVQRYARHAGIKVSDETVICEEYLVEKAES